MPDRLSLLVLLLWLAGLPASADTPPVDDAGAWLAERDRVLAASAAASGFVPAGEPAAERPEPRGRQGAGEPQVVGSDVRLALTQMALAVGSAGQAEIAAAQATEGPGAIFLRAGHATLADLHEATRGTALEAVLRQEEGIHVVSRPIVVVQGATLALEPGDVLEFQGGAFLLSFGHLTAAGATFRTDAPPPDQETEFRPFVASLGTGTLDVSWSVFVGLGSNLGPVASGLAMSSGSLFAGSGSSVVRDSRFIDVHGLSMLDSNGALVLDNRFDAPRGIAIWADSSDRVEIRGNSVTQSGGAFAVRIDGPASGVRLTDNVLLDGEHAGVRLAREAAAVDLRGNVIEGFAGRGIVAEDGVTCLRLAGNLIRDNGGDGISAQDIGDALIAGNVIVGNGGAGVSLARSRPEAGLLVAGNLVAQNRSGVRAASIGSLLVSGNDLSGQSPRHLADDLSQHTPLFLRESRGDAFPSLSFHAAQAEVAEPVSPEAVHATFEDCRMEEGS